MFTAELHGLRELQDQLRSLGDAVAVKVLAKAARLAFMPVIDAAKAMAPIRRGVLRDSIKVAVKKRAGGQDGVVVVGLRIAPAPVRIGDHELSGKERRALKASRVGRKILAAQPARRWHFAEFGTVHQAAHPFIRPAWDQNVGPMLDLLKVEIAKEIQRYVARARRKASS